MPDYQVSGEKKREIGNKKQPEAWVWASAVEGRAFLQRSLSAASSPCPDLNLIHYRLKRFFAGEVPPHFTTGICDALPTIRQREPYLEFTLYIIRFKHLIFAIFRYSLFPETYGNRSSENQKKDFQTTFLSGSCAAAGTTVSACGKRCSLYQSYSRFRHNKAISGIQNALAK